MESSRCLRVGRLDVQVPFLAETQHGEVPDEWEGGLLDVGHHVHVQGAPWWKASLSRLPDQTGQRPPQESLACVRVTFCNFSIL